MKHIILTFILLSILASCQQQRGNETALFSEKQVIVSDDITHFYEAYDAIHTTDDTLRQMEFLQTLFLNKASLGQQRMIEARRYTASEYLASIVNRPLFWNSIRKNTENTEEFNKKLRSGVDKLSKVYPELEMSTIYYTIGNFRSPGTGVDSMVLIGTEYALGDTTVNTTELPEHVQNYYKINPIDRLEFLTVHEYIHTQQTEMVHNLLSLTLYEGIAEFMAINATQQASPWKAFEVGQKNGEKVRERFEEDMFKPNTVYNWLWNSSDNEFGANEMSYFVGSKIASLYYDKTTDKQGALKRLIELDYSDEDEVEAVVDETQYFSGTLESLHSDYELLRPTVRKVDLDITDGRVEPGRKSITVHFSESMNIKHRGFEYGPLGENHALRVDKVIGFSNDGKAFTFEVVIKANKQYQSTLSDNFRSETGYQLKPYVIDFKTN